MKVYELLSFNKELLKKIHTAGIKPDDYKYVDLYADYVSLKSNGEKVSYIVAKLSDKYQVSERQVYSVIGKMERDVSTAKIAQ